MKVLILIMLALLSVANAQERIVSQELRRDVVHRIPCAAGTVTTVTLPGAISSLDGSGFIADPGVETGKFMLAFRPGDSFFAVEPLVANAKANLNVMVGGEVYVLLVEADQLGFAFVVRFEEEGSAGGFVTPKGDVKKATERHLVSLLEVVKGYELLNRYNKDALTGISAVDGDPIWTEVEGGVSVRLVRAIRRDAIDAVGYMFEIRSSRRLVLDYPSVGIVSGGRHFTGSLVDMNAVVSPGKTGIIAVVIQGDGRGGRNNLSAESPVSLVVNELNGSVSE